MSDKYQREIEEILRKMSFSSPKQKRRPSGWSSDVSSTWRNLTVDLSPTRLYALGLALTLLGFIARASFPLLAAPLTLFAVILLGTGFVLSLTRRGARRPSTWRGRTVDSGGEFWSGLWRRWEQWWHRRGGS